MYTTFIFYTLLNAFVSVKSLWKMNASCVASCAKVWNPELLQIGALISSLDWTDYQAKHIAGSQRHFSGISVHERVFLSGAGNLRVLVNEVFFLS